MNWIIAATAVRDMLSPDTQEKYQLYKFLPHWGWRTWVALFAILNVVLVIEGAIRAIWKRERVHQAEIDKHEARLVEHKDKISQLLATPLTEGRSERQIKSQALRDFADWLDRNATPEWGYQAMIGHARTMAAKIEQGQDCLGKNAPGSNSGVTGTGE